jgi:hypothetical protein
MASRFFRFLGYTASWTAFLSRTDWKVANFLDEALRYRLSSAMVAGEQLDNLDKFLHYPHSSARGIVGFLSFVEMLSGIRQ